MLEGHYARPGEKRRFHSRQEFWHSYRTVRLDWWTWSENDSSQGEPETYWVHGDSVLYQENPRASAVRLSSARAEQSRLLALAPFPELLAQTPFRRKPILQRVNRGLLSAVAVSQPHPRLGDVTDELELDYSVEAFVAARMGSRSQMPLGAQFGGDAPPRFTLSIHERDHSWILNATRVWSRESKPPRDMLTLPEIAASPELSDSLSSPPPFRSIAQGVWALDLEDLETRTLVVEFADHLAVIEMAVSSANGERIVDAVKRRWPRKPIRYALFSHHHPHYVGGLRAFLAEGATIVTTPGNDSLVHAIARYPFTIEPDRLARTRQAMKPNVRVFPRRLELADHTNRLVAVNIGTRSQHTDEFVIFWLPRQRLLFESEQGWFTANDTLRASRRAAQFLRTIDEERLQADRIVQSWPMRGTPGELRRTELDSLVAKRR